MHRAILQPRTLGTELSRILGDAWSSKAGYVTWGRPYRSPSNPLILKNWNFEGSRHLLPAAALLSALTICTAWASCSDEPTPLQKLHLRMLREWLIENEADVEALEFHAVNVRIDASSIALCWIDPSTYEIVTPWGSAIGKMALPDFNKYQV
jgi:hypothetical protein